jgi:membrane protein
MRDHQERPDRGPARTEQGAFAWATPMATGLLLGLAISFADLYRQTKRSPAERRDVSAAVQGADHPLPVPARGWKDILLKSIKAFNADQIPAWAGGVTFFCLLAMFPALSVFVSLYGLFSNTNRAREQIIGLSGLLPAGAISVLDDQLTLLSRVDHGSLGIAFAAGLLLSIWSSNAGVKSLFAGLNTAYERKERRGFIRLNLISLGFTFGLVLFSILSIATIAAVPETLGLIGLGWLSKFAFLRWPLILVVVGAVLALLYRFGPSRHSARWRWITPGCAVAAIGWLLMSLGFSWYVANFGHYDKTYGALGGVVGFMTWIWLSAMVVLFGAEINCEVERQAKA